MEISDSEKSLNGSRRLVAYSKRLHYIKKLSRILCRHLIIAYYRPFSNIDEDLDDIECDNPESPGDLCDLKQEVLSAYQQLRNMCAILRQRGKQRRNSSDSLDTTSSSEEPQVASVKVGHLTGVMQELKGLLHDILRKEAKGTCPTCGADVNDRMKLEIQLHKTQENFEKMERDLKKKEEESKARDNEIKDLLSKVTLAKIY